MYCSIILPPKKYILKSVFQKITFTFWYWHMWNCSLKVSLKSSLSRHCGQGEVYKFIFNCYELHGSSSIITMALTGRFIQLT